MSSTPSHDYAELLSRLERLEKEKSSLMTENAALQVRNEDLQQQLAWFKKQIFGRRSEKLLSPHPDQLTLGEYLPQDAVPEPGIKVTAYERQYRKEKVAFKENESRLKFDESVPVEERVIEHPDTEGLSSDEYEVIGEEVSHRLAQRPGAYVVIRYRRKKVKLKETAKIVTAPLPAPALVIERSIAEASFLAGLIIDKFRYHLPLYRQHQRLQASGLTINRMTLTNLVHRSAELLEPVYCAIQSSILSGAQITMDETPLKVVRDPNKHQMKKGYLWGIYGEEDELAFIFSASRAGKVVREVLGAFEGTLLSDGYKVYERFALERSDVIHAQCWAHTRRKFYEAKDSEPELSEKALFLISSLYAVEAEGARKEKAEPIVNEFFLWLSELFQRQALLPSSPFTKAASYALQREAALRVFLEDSKLALDTNHLERQIRPIAVGRKNWMFHWTEMGAEKAAILQSLIACCTLQKVDPYTYLVDVLQRIDSHPMIDIDLLTPRLWKQHFADNPMRAELDSGYGLS